MPVRSRHAAPSARSGSGRTVRLDATARYTRTLTAIWCVFFLASSGVSLALAWFASQRAWSWFANVANFPLAMILFAGEYAYRLRRFRDRSHTSPLRTIARFATASATLFGSNGGGSR
jgi:intracellular septation protein A